MATAMQYRFVNAAHERCYHDAKRLLAEEDERQREEAEKLMAEWRYLPEDAQRERASQLRRHFAACREPYVKILADVLSLATPILTVHAYGQSPSKP